MCETIVDSIAIAVLNKNAIIRGVGNELQLLTSATATKDLGSDLRLVGKVHGIAVGNNEGQELLVVYGEREFMLLECSEQWHFKLVLHAYASDWISAAHILQNNKEFVLLTAHSVLLRFGLLTQQWQLMERYSCTDKSTLYCAHLHGAQWQHLVVFGGNAFGELLIWQPKQTAYDENNANKLFKVPLLQCHSAHNGVIFSICYNECKQLLITTSDDRSVRFWHVKDLQQSNWSAVKLLELATAYGHMARVFCGKLIEYDNQVLAVTVGEDSYLCIWRSNGELLHKCRQQFGATIWNFVYVEESCTIYTIGSTGNILPLNLNAALTDKTLKRLPEISSSKQIYVAKIKFINSNLLVGITNQNSLVYMQLTKENSANAWKEISKVDNFKCTVLEVNEQLIAICGSNRLLIFRVNTEQLIFTKVYDQTDVLKGVIRSIQIHKNNRLLISDDLGNCCFSENLFIAENAVNIKWSEICLPTCKEPWLTTSLLCEDKFLLVSNRLGNLMLYECLTNNEYALRDTLKHPHGNLGATVLQLDEDGKEIYVHSAGRDGYRKTHYISNQAKIICQLSETLPVAWVEAVCHVADMQLYLGFNDNHFVVWSKQHDFLAEIPCGGGHRCWHFTLCKATLQLKFVFIQNRGVSYKTLSLFQHLQSNIQLPMRNHWHIRACNAATLIPSYLISAGDDNLIKFTKLGQKLQHEIELHAHISNIRALKCWRTSNGNFEYLLLSAGGRAQLCLHGFKANNLRRIKLLWNYTLNSHKQQEKSSSAFSFDPQTRIMCLDCFEASSQLHIFLGCSDGYLRKLCLDADYQVVAEMQLFLKRCVLQTRLIEQKYLLVATTAGVLLVYDLELSSETIFELQHHASGVNALDLAIYDNTLHILTGGDDQSVVYSKMPLHKRTAVTKKFPNFHTAQVNAVCLTENAKYAYTCGVDQQLLKIDLCAGSLIKSQQICVPDVKGMCVLNKQNICFIYGCGLQSIKLDQN